MKNYIQIITLGLILASFISASAASSSSFVHPRETDYMEENEARMTRFSGEYGRHFQSFKSLYEEFWQLHKTLYQRSVILKKMGESKRRISRIYRNVMTNEMMRESVHLVRLLELPLVDRPMAFASMIRGINNPERQEYFAAKIGAILAAAEITGE